MALRWMTPMSPRNGFGIEKMVIMRVTDGWGAGQPECITRGASQVALSTPATCVA